jgi:HK97 family phage prohead protease
MHKNYITRFLPLEAFVTKSLESNGTNEMIQVVGYGSIFNLKDLHKDIVIPGAFSAVGSKAIPKPQMLWQHNKGQSCGEWLSVREDDYGLRLEGVVSSAFPFGKIAIDQIKAGNISGLSIGFYVSKFHIDNGVRIIEEVSLIEVSIVTNPACPHARFVPRTYIGSSESSVHQH